MKGRMDARVLVFSAFWLMDVAWALYASPTKALTLGSYLRTFAVAGVLSYSAKGGLMMPALLSRVWETVKAMPFVWDSDLWAIQNDVAIALGALTTVRWQFAAFYFFSGFWKLNTSFLDPRASCATIFFAQIAARFFPFASLSFAKIAPLATVSLELSIGIVMLYGLVGKRRCWIRRGALLAFILHFAICLTPPPNDISPFALKCSVRLVFFSTAKSARKVLETKVLTTSGAGGLMVAFAGALLASSIFDWNPKQWSFFLYVLQSSFTLTALALEDEDEMTTFGRSEVIGFVGAMMYGLGGLLTGIQEQMSPNMFANLKIHGGSNHVIMPTGILQHWYATKPATHPFGGGIIRVEETDSPWLSTMYPADFTMCLDERTIQTLEHVGMPTPCYFNPGFSRILGLHTVPPQEKFYRYTVVAAEMRRLFVEAKDHDQNFTLTYSKLPGFVGDERWRAFAVEETIVVKVKRGNVMTCKKKKEKRTTQCEANDIPLLPDAPASWLMDKLGLYHGYPIVATKPSDEVPEGIRCFGP